MCTHQMIEDESMDDGQVEVAQLSVSDFRFSCFRFVFFFGSNFIHNEVRVFSDSLVTCAISRLLLLLSSIRGNVVEFTCTQSHCNYAFHWKSFKVAETQFRNFKKLRDRNFSRLRSITATFRKSTKKKKIILFLLRKFRKINFFSTFKSSKYSRDVTRRTHTEKKTQQFLFEWKEQTAISTKRKWPDRHVRSNWNSFACFFFSVCWKWVVVSWWWWLSLAAFSLAACGSLACAHSGRNVARLLLAFFVAEPVRNENKLSMQGNFRPEHRMQDRERKREKERAQRKIEREKEIENRNRDDCMCFVLHLFECEQRVSEKEHIQRIPFGSARVLRTYTRCDRLLR